MSDNKLCYGCMENTGGYAVCPECGYTRDSANMSPYLAAGTVLNDRYIIGKLLHHNGESADYIAYDKTLDCKLIIKEYMPENLCTRDKNGIDINANHNHKVQYKALMDEFAGLNRSIARMRTISHIIPINDIFSLNNTSYAVFEYTESSTLLEYLKENAGELTWEQVSKLFPPFFTTLSIIHNAGIVHRGISPETILINDKGELKLQSFSVSPLRTLNTELKSELFHGYSAPEQYSLSGWQGTWTDVYGISAVLYRILTGCRPTEAQTRISNDSLCPPHEINPNISESVSNTIMAGLAVKSEDRIQTITELVTRLFEEDGEVEKINRSTHTATIAIPRQAVSEPPKPPRPKVVKPRNSERVVAAEKISEAEVVPVIDRIKVPLMIGVLLIAIFLVIGIIGMAFFSGNGESEIDLSIYGNSSSSVDNVIEMTAGTGDEEMTGLGPDSDMPNLVGYHYEDVAESSTFLGWLVIEPEYVFNDKVEKGLIMEQSINPGDKFKTGDTVIVTVSKGPEKVEVPDYMLTSYSSYKYEEYFELLESLGIEYEPLPEVNWGYADGYVIGITINGERVKGGTVINLKAGEVLGVKYTDNYGQSNEQTYYYKNDETEEAEETTKAPVWTTKAPSWTTTVATTKATVATTKAPVATTQATTQAPVVTEPPVVTEAPVVTEPPVVTQAPEVQQPVENNNGEGNEVANEGVENAE